MSTMKQIRLDKGVSQLQISEITGIHPSVLSRIENGKQHPTPRTQRAIASALGVLPREIEWPVVAKKG